MASGIYQAALVTAKRALEAMPYWQAFQGNNSPTRNSRSSQTCPSWDPEECDDWKNEAPPKLNAILRIQQDVNATPPSGCYVERVEEDLTLVHVLMTGPDGTPYEGGFFYFLVRFPPDYPRRPPRVKFMTTRGNSVRFNPTLYRNGKVCLSLLGTWHENSWTPAHCLFTVLEEIRRFMNKEPYYNEPDLIWHGLVLGGSERYNDFLYYETIRSAVCEMIEHPNPKLPETLKSRVKELFLEKFDFYMTRIEEKKHLDNKPMTVNAYGEREGTFNFAGLRERLNAIRLSFEE